MMTSSAYTGRDNLTVMRAAKRYNAAIAQELRNAITGTRILDFGAGDGLFAECVAETHTRPVCIEPDHDLAQSLREKGFEVHASLAGAKGSFDTLYSVNVMEHILDDTGTLEQLASAAAPEAHLFLFVPAWPLLYGPMDRKVGHHRRYRREELTDKLSRANWRPLRVRFFDSLGFLAALAHRIAGRDNGELTLHQILAYDRWIFPASASLDHVMQRFIGKNLLAVAIRQ